MELFAGAAWTSRCMRTAGVPTASMDIQYQITPRDPMKQNCMDLCSEAGFSFLGRKFNCSMVSKMVKQIISGYDLVQYVSAEVAILMRLALLTILNCKFNYFLVVIGLVCSSFVAVSAGTHARTPWSPYGRTDVEFVQVGNLLASRLLC